MAKLITGRHIDGDKLGEVVTKSEWDLIKENTDEDGVVKCFKCESSYLVHEIRDVLIGSGINKPKLVPLESYFCDECDYIYIQTEEVAEIREFLKAKTV